MIRQNHSSPEQSTFVRAITARPDMAILSILAAAFLAYYVSQELSHHVSMSTTGVEEGHYRGELEGAPAGERVTHDEYYSECSNPLNFTKRHVWIEGSHKEYYSTSEYQFTVQSHWKCAWCGMWYT